MICMNPVDGGRKTALVGYFETAIGGKIPNWVVNFVSHQMPKEMKGEFEKGYTRYVEKGLVNKQL